MARRRQSEPIQLWPLDCRSRQRVRGVDAQPPAASANIGGADQVDAASRLLTSLARAHRRRGAAET